MLVLPLGETVLIKLLEQVDKKTDSGIIITGTEVAKEELPMAEVMALGNNCMTPIEVGDKVLVSKYAGSPAPDNQRILPLDQVLAICKS